MAHAKKILNIGNQLLFAAAKTLSRKPDTFRTTPVSFTSDDRNRKTYLTVNLHFDSKATKWSNLEENTFERKKLFCIKVTNFLAQTPH